LDSGIPTAAEHFHLEEALRRLRRHRRRHLPGLHRRRHREEALDPLRRHRHREEALRPLHRRRREDALRPLQSHHRRHETKARAYGSAALVHASEKRTASYSGLLMAKRLGIRLGLTSESLLDAGFVKRRTRSGSSPQSRDWTQYWLPDPKPNETLRAQQTPTALRLRCRSDLQPS
jgi:hypothetical protein